MAVVTIASFAAGLRGLTLLTECLLVTAFALGICALPAGSQGKDTARLEKLLDKVEKDPTKSWAGPRQGSRVTQPAGPYIVDPATRRQLPAWLASPGKLNGPAGRNSSTGQGMLPALMPGGNQRQPAGGSLDSVLYERNVALSAADRAWAAAARAGHGEKAARLSAAAEARYHANIAAAAADRAVSGAAAGPPEANSAAAVTRAAANRAQAAAQAADSAAAEINY